MTRKIKKTGRNESIVDVWTIPHVLSGVLLGWLMNPIAAFFIMTAWEPLEIFILSPIMARYGILFGHESLRNSLSDIVFNTIGILTGFYLLSELLSAPFKVF